MTNTNFVSNSLKEKGLYPKSENKQFGLNISLTSNKELIINGTSEDFIELSDLLVSLAMSKINDHFHIDELTLINDNSSIKEIIIEKNKLQFESEVYYGNI